MEKEFVFKKRPLGVEDIAFDIFGDGEAKVYTLDDGSTISVQSLNANHIPLTGKTRRELNSISVDDALITLSKIAGSSSNISMTDDKTITFSTTDDVENMQRLIDACERNLGGHTLTVIFPANQMQIFNGTLEWKNFYNGKIIVQGTSANNKITVKDQVSNAGELFAFENCQCDITVAYFDFIHKYNTYAITCNASSGIVLDHCRFEGNGGNSQSVLLKSGGLCYCDNCTFYNDKEPNPQSDIITVKNSYLPLSGGTMTGSLTVNNTLTVSGNLTVGGKNAVRSVNNKTADTSGNASVTITDIPDLKSTLDNKLSLSGGTMTGSLVMAAGGIKRADATNALWIFSGTGSADGAYIEIGGKDYQGEGKGGNIFLVAKNGTNASSFKVTPAGTLMLDGAELRYISRPIALQSNEDLNTYYNKNGYFMAANDTVAKTIANRPCDVAFVVESYGYSGAISYQRATRYTDGTVFVRRYYNGTWSGWRPVTMTVAKDNSSQNYIHGGIEYGQGASLLLWGKTHDNGTDSPGMFKIVANNGTNSSNLIGTPKGGLSWNGFDITLGYPNYSAGTSTTASSYTANADGWVVVSKQQSGSYLRVKVNGGVVIDAGGSDSDRTSGMFPVKAGDTVTIFSTAQDGKTETATSATIYFYLNR